jgi:hypothetical protein
MDDLDKEGMETGMPVLGKVSSQRFPQAGLQLIALLLFLAGYIVGRSSFSQETPRVIWPCSIWPWDRK